MISARRADVPWVLGVLGAALVAMPILWISPLLVVAMVPAVAALFVLAARPVWSIPLVFAALMISDGVDFDLRVGVVLTVGKFGMLFVLAAWGLHCLAARRWPVEMNGFWLAHGGMLAVLILGLGINRFVTETEVMYVFGFFLLGIMAQVVIATFRAEDARTALVAVALVYLGVVIAGLFIGKPIVTTSFSRNAGFGGNPNQWALTVLMGLPPAVAILESQKSKLLRGLALVTLLVGVAAVLGTVSRSGLLVLTAVSPAFVMIFWQRKLVLAGLAVLAIAASPVVIDFASIEDRMESFVDEGEQEMDGSLRDRSIVLAFALESIAERPLLGVGTGAFPREVEIATGGQVALVAHNTYLGVLTELGIVGGAALAGFLGYLIALLVGAWRRQPSPLARRITLALACSMLAYMIFCLAIEALYLAPGFFWFAVMVSWSQLTHLPRERLEAVGLA